ncbi:hypothetical protein BIV25_14310 [Streptomyces sp. MUSC 14]|uniref:molybdopterin oxidoreductase family protein n=1 Tax=Streptomyces sp. MUSC 14 TaxID=1354889 RepID=UPI0008F56B1A|nr:molybdopterin oxidoreductase family protein [Streptomyces sp. MUSC 14]OIJ97425.1 hypothetical protein BIV25_14310 [Streptomyces sp. MUSC 14]
MRDTETPQIPQIPQKRPPKTYTRLTHPLLRDARNKPFRQATWEEVLDRAADGFARHRGAFGMFSCARATNEMNYVAQKFARVVMGTNNVDSCNRTCHAPSVAGLSAAFGSGGTSSYEEIEHTDVIVMWGSNARFAHPIFFQYVLKGIRGGARMYAVDPRRTSTAQWAESWLGLNVGTDIPMAHAIGREIIHAGLVNEAFVARATTGFEEYRRLVEPWTLSLAEKATGVPGGVISEAVWNELRSVSPDHYGMTYERLEEHRGIQWPCPSTQQLEPTYLHGRLRDPDPRQRGALAPFGLVAHDPPVDLTDERFPIRLTTRRRLDSYNTGVRSGGFASPLRRGEYVELCPEDAERYGVAVGEEVRVSSRRGSVVAPVWIDTALRPGLAFMTMHFPDEVDTNQLTTEANCPIAGTAEFKASAIRIDRLPATATAQVG